MSNSFSSTHLMSGAGLVLSTKSSALTTRLPHLRQHKSSEDTPMRAWKHLGSSRAAVQLRSNLFTGVGGFEATKSFSLIHHELVSGGQVLNHITQDGRQRLPHLRQHFELLSVVTKRPCVRQVIKNPKFNGAEGYEATKSFSLIHQELVSTKLLSFSYWLPHSIMEDECCQEFVPISAEKGRDLVFGGATKTSNMRRYDNEL